MPQKSKGMHSSIVMEINLHGMLVQEAKRHLDMKITAAPKNIREVVVIHGYNRGSALLQMVRSSYRHPRVKQKLLSMNPGVTTYLLG